MVKTEIFVTYKFEGIHCYPAAPEEVAFLRVPHRHMFHVKATIEVFHDDRELEFIMVKRELEAYTKETFDFLNNKSCEMIARKIISKIADLYGESRAISVEVSEDGENGAVVSYQP